MAEVDVSGACERLLDSPARAGDWGWDHEESPGALVDFVYKTTHPTCK